ncbi:MAG: polyprenyl diphosphate synthase [Candidatus Aenigmatarchaeota archaeon]
MIPQHIGVILDGNRRFAKQLMKKPWIGHKFGPEKTREVLRWACDSGIKYVTAYVLSLENLKSRPRHELNIILNYVEKEADNILENHAHAIHELNVNVRFIGRVNLLPNKLRKKIRAVELATQKYKKHFLNIAIAYGGRQEIVDATRKILEKGLKGIIKPHNLNENIMKAHLYTNGQPYPDMIFRTGGEKRLSNFMAFQSAYSEFIFTDKKWPELTKEDFNDALDEYARRKRKFGK